MGIFDYVCYINNADCPLRKSRGQDFTDGRIFAVDKDLKKKISCYYTGYGYSEINKRKKSHEIYDLGYEELYNDLLCIEEDKLYSYFACPQCASMISSEYDLWEDFIK